MTPISQISPYIMPGMDRLNVEDRILKAVCRATGISAIQIRSKYRKIEVVAARHLFIYFLCKKTHYSLSKIGGIARTAMDPMNHSSIIHARTTIQDYIDIKDKPTLKLVKLIEEAL